MTAALRLRDVRMTLLGGGVVGPWSGEIAAGGAWGMTLTPAEADHLVRLTVGTEHPDAGVLEVLGTDPGSLSRRDLLTLRRRLGVVFRRGGLVSNLTLRDNMVVPLVYGGHCPPARALALAAEALQAVGLAEQASRRPSALAEETRVLASLVRAAIHGPELLVVEAPSSGLSTAATGRALDWCRRRAGTMLILTPEASGLTRSAVDGWLPSLNGGEVPQE